MIIRLNLIIDRRLELNNISYFIVLILHQKVIILQILGYDDKMCFFFNYKIHNFTAEILDFKLQSYEIHKVDEFYFQY